MEASVAINKKLDLYLRLERITIEFDDRGDPFADQLRDLMDPIWYDLTDEDREFLNNRGEVELHILYPVTLTVPDLMQEPLKHRAPAIEILPEGGVGRRFALKEDIWAA
jgi:hypothetical protein